MNFLSSGRPRASSASAVHGRPDSSESIGASPAVSATRLNRAFTAIVCLAIGSAFAASVQAKPSPPTFTQARGFYSSPFSLTLAQNPADTATTLEIHYTVDGSVPTATTGQTYTSPLAINTTAVVRAVVVDTSNPTDVSATATHTYLFVPDVLGQPTDIPSQTDPRFSNYPAYPRNTYDVGNNGTRVHDYQMDPRIVNSPTYAPLVQGSLMAIPTLSIATGLAGMFGTTGYYDADAEVGCSMELLYPGNSAADQQIDGSIQGHSSVRLKRSLRLSWSSAFGPSKFTSPIMQQAPLHGSTATGSFDTLVLRAGNNRAWARVWNPDLTAYTEDQWYRDSQIAISGVGAHGTFVHLYINGLYWGLYNPAERPDESFAAAYLGGKKGAYFSLKEDGRTKGDATRWNYLTGTLIPRDLTVPANYAEVQGYLDVPAFSDYLLLAWYAGVNDWPNNNWWVVNRNDVPGPARFFSWDGEWSWTRGNPFDPSIKGEAPNGAWVHPAFRAGSTDASFQARFWRALRVNSDFMTTFADRVSLHTSAGGALGDINARLRWNRLNMFVEDAVIAESARWGDAITPSSPRTRDVDWQRAVDSVYGLMGGNGSKLIAALRAQHYYPSIDAPRFSRAPGNVPEGSELTVTNPNIGGTIYYTIDGSDPRLSGGAVNSTAQIYSAPIAISAPTTLKSRVLSGSEWSALAAANFSPTSVNSAPVVTAVGPITVTLPGTITLNSIATDDGLPSNTLSLEWSATGPGSVTFSAPTAADTTATFSAAGSYVLRLTASDGALQSQSDVPVFVNAAPTAGGTLTSFTLINADNEQPIPGYAAIPDGAVLDLSALPTKNLNIRANTSPALVGSVRFAFQNSTNYRTETGAPYALFGDTNGNYAAWVPPLGSYTVKGTPYSGASASGTPGVPLTIHFSVVQSSASDATPPSVPTNLSSTAVTSTSFTLSWTASSDNVGVTGYEVFGNGASVGTATGTSKSITGLSPNTTYNITVRARDAAGNWSDDSAPRPVTTAAAPNQVVSFTLIDADTDLPVPGYNVIPNGAVIDRAGLPTTHLNIRVNTNPAVIGSVRIAFDSQSNARTESGAPYALFGDNSGNYNAGTIANGTHTIKGTPYTGANASGTAGAPLAISFTIQ